MNALGQLLTPDDILVDVEAGDRPALLLRAAELLAQRHGVVASSIAEALSARERLGSTALGHGIALPHARIAGLPQPYAGFLRTRAGIPFDASDARPVSQFLTLVVPAQATERHLQLLACAATMFSERSFRDALRAALTPADIAAIFATWSPEGA